MKRLLGDCQEKVKSLSDRVAYLECLSQKKSSISIVEGNVIKSMQIFASKLLPSMNSRDRLKHIFNALYNRFKSFKSHVKKTMSQELHEQLRMEVFREIKKYFPPWRFLEVMDCSQQSLNQVSLIGDFLFVQKSFPKWAKVLPEIKRIRGAQKKSNSHLSDLIPISYAQDCETGWFEYRPFLEYILKKTVLLDIIDDDSTTEPVLVAVTFDGG